MKIGDTVKLRNGVFVGAISKDHKNHETAEVKRFLAKDRVYLNRELHGSHYWLKTELVVIE